MCGPALNLDSLLDVQVAHGLLQLNDGEALLGLHAWAGRAFEAVLKLLQQQRSLQQLRQMQEQGGSHQGQAQGQAQGGAASGKQQQQQAVDDAPGAAGGGEEEDVDLPFGRPARSSAASGGAGAAGGGGGEAAELAWLRGVAYQSQGR